MTKKTELKIHGFNACMAVFKSRPEAIVRVYLTQARMKVFGDVVKMCVQKRKAYHVVSNEELADMSGATHNEGICFVIKLPDLISPKELSQRAQKPGIWLALEDVGNPHNLGAIQRSAAHFGAAGVFLIDPKTSWETGAFYRTAEGGAECVPVIPVESVKELLNLAKELKLTPYATTGHKGMDLYKTKLATQSLIFMGAEGPGLSKTALSSIQNHLQIPGTGAVESLNVGIASTLVLAEWYRQHRS